MKYLIALFLFVSGLMAQAQTNRTVMADTNGVVQRPTNFWAANSNSINAVVNGLSSFAPVEFVYRVQQYFFGNNTTESNNATISVANSSLSISIAATNTNASGAVRLIADVNSGGNGGFGTRFANDSHASWIRLEALPRESGLVRFVLGNPSSPSTNIAVYPTNRAIGFELRSLSASATNEVRLFAHNGTTNTNGPWVVIGDVIQDYTLGVSQNKTNGEVRLFVGQNQNAPTIDTNATILGGPTNNAGNGQSALEIGLFTTNTNASTIVLRVNSALVEITD